MVRFGCGLVNIKFFPPQFISGLKSYYLRIMEDDSARLLLASAFFLCGSLRVWDRSRAVRFGWVDGAC